VEDLLEMRAIRVCPRCNMSQPMRFEEATSRSRPWHALPRDFYFSPIPRKEQKRQSLAGRAFSNVPRTRIELVTPGFSERGVGVRGRSRLCVGGRECCFSGILSQIERPGRFARDRLFSGRSGSNWGSTR